MTDHLYRKMLQVGVPLAAVQQKMSAEKVPQESVDSVLAQHIVNLSTQVNPIAPITQDYTVTYTMLPCILAQLNTVGGEYSVMRDLVQKLREIETRHKILRSGLKESRRRNLGSNRKRRQSKKAATRIQALVRGFVQRGRFQAYFQQLQHEGLLVSSALVIQCFMRTVIAKKKMISMKKARRRRYCRAAVNRTVAARRIQALARGVIQRAKDESGIQQIQPEGLSQSSILSIQCLMRMAIAKKETRRRLKRIRRNRKKFRKAAIRIQALVRGVIERAKYPFWHGLRYHPRDDSIAVQLLKWKRQIEEIKEKGKADLEDAKFQYEQELEEYRERIEDKLHDELYNSEEQREKAKIIENTRKQNIELRQQCQSIGKDCKSLKETNCRLVENCTRSVQAHETLRKFLSDANIKNARLTKFVDACENKMTKMKAYRQNQELHYLHEAKSRVRYQKLMARIVAQIQDRSRDAQFVDEVVTLALDIGS
mmetsp:Transcript_24002/g.58678  ORF Transcript_24002/g.58678 Transcript_24002/m.58678 type:complete len:482 (-) Transcript_24002:212-1657(-)